MTQPVVEGFTPIAKVNQQPWPGNDAGTAQFTRPTMCRFIIEDGDLPEMRALASKVLEEAGWPSTDRGKVEALTAYTRAECHYIPDSPYRESVYRPRFLYCLGGADAKLCVKIGDCSNMNCALGALCRSAGFDVKVQGIDYGAGIQPHVNIIVLLRDEGGKWAEADATTTKPVGFVSPGKKDVLDPHDPKVTGAAAKQGAFIGAAGAFVGAGKPWDALPMHGYASAIFARRDVGAGAPQLTLQPCYQFSIDVDLQGATDADLQASLPTWASSVRNLSVSSFGNSTTITGTWNGSASFTVPTSIPVAHDFGGNTGYQTVQVLVTGGSVGALDTTGGCVPVCPTGAHWNGSSCVACPPDTYWNGNACIQPPPSGGSNAPIHTGSTYHPPANTGGTGGTQSSTGLSTGAKVGLIAGGALLLGGGAFAAYKAGWFGRAA
ncbi:MAG: hypothetical protein ACYDDA_04725 [Acidiferrobacteraceae bacterium]